ncbi:MAG TPA: hypothetical protein VG322_02430 [Candidatus Acidoferrales bacterium]|nr:hypothetical protein [Candidatus Acidoferrales bacterium]
MMQTAKKKQILLGLFVLLALPAARAQQGTPTMPDRPGRDAMPGMDMGDDPDQARAAGKTANDSMADHDMKMSPHMFMTDLRPRNAADDQRAAQIVDELRKSIVKYKDYKVALADGFRIFMPNLPQPIYHFTNYGYGYEAEFHFDPLKPTSLLYKKAGDGYELVGAMYTAPKSFSNDQLNERVPLSVARWHEHVNICLPQRGTPLRDVDWQKFGAEGSIATQAACEEAGGRFLPLIFNWMVHVYPFETDPNNVWAH